MTRLFTPNDLIQLPRMNSNEAAVLVTEILNAATAAAKALKIHALPGNIEASRKRLTGTKAALDKALTPALPSDVDTNAQRVADRAIDNAWSATYDWLRGWTKLPDQKHGAAALSLFNLLFPSALSFTQLAYKSEWQESANRLRAIKDHDGEKTFKALGGQAFLSHLEEAHEKYGIALGITRVNVKPEDPRPSPVRPALEAMLTELRGYINKVTAHADPDLEGSEELAAALLKPLTSWETRPASRDSGASTTGSTPPPPPAPATSTSTP